MDAPLAWQSILIAVLGALSLALLWRLHSLRQPDAHAGEALPSSRLSTCPASQVRVRDLMSKELITLAPEDSAKRAWRMLQ